ncbi:hypothetical protein [Krasilnikovia sp. MM14-A1259]|uniref:hypothetical protein n=1 Tax=Krasilnikovia sp. MM14-A1259 TaxID=3373539 RepID=UPI0038064C74
MTTEDASASRATRIGTYLILGFAFIALLGIGLATFRTGKTNQQANAQADQLVAALGLPASAEDRVAKVLGDDGGMVCAAPNDPLARSELLASLSNGAGGPGTRPVVADEQAVNGMQQIINIYCPDQAAEFEKFVADLKVANTAK